MSRCLLSVVLVLALVTSVVSFPLRSGAIVPQKDDGSIRHRRSWPALKQELGHTFQERKHQFDTWLKAKPHRGRNLVIVGAGACGVLATAFCAAPAISAGVTAYLTPTIGVTAAKAVGAGVAGGVGSAVGSFWAHGTPMALGSEFHKRRLIVDTALSAGFGMVGFMQANLVKQAAEHLVSLGGIWPMLRIPFTASLLVGYEMGKDFVQNGSRNFMAQRGWIHLRNGQDEVVNKNGHNKTRKPGQKFWSEIWPETLALEILTNLHRSIPGLEDNVAAKALIDTFAARVGWDYITNHMPPNYFRDMVRRFRSPHTSPGQQNGRNGFDPGDVHPDAYH